MENKIFLLILVIHFLADFVLQTDWQAKNKSSNDDALALHCLTYSLVWFLISFIVLGVLWKAFLFFGITFMLHYATDYFTSRWAKKFFDKNDFHNAFVIIGMDQVLHYLQLYYTFEMFVEW